jgi:hypothetical protein
VLIVNLVSASADVRAGASPEPRVETLEVPRDLGALPQADIVWAPPTGGEDHVAADVVVEYAEETGRVRGMVTKDGDVSERWKLTLDPDEELLGVAGTADVTALALRRDLVGFDARTGGRRWSAGGRVDWVRALGHDFIVAFEMPPLDPSVAPYDNGWPRDLVRLDGRTGRTRWRVPCVDKLCSATDANDAELVVTGHEAIVRVDAQTGKTLSRIKRPGETAALGAEVSVDGDVAVIGEPAGAGEKAGLVVKAISLVDGNTLWRTPLAVKGDAWFHAWRWANHVVAVADNVIAVLQRGTGALLSTVSLPTGWRAGKPVWLRDGRVAVPESADDAALLAVVDNRGTHPVSLWALPREVELRRGDERERVFGKRDWGTLRWTFEKESGWNASLPPPRGRLSLAEDVAGRLERLLAETAAADGPPADREGTLPFLRRLGPEAYRDALLTRVRRGDVDAGPVLALLAEQGGPKGQAALREACLAGLGHVAAELPRADGRRRLRLVRASLGLMEATTGVLAEAPVRGVGEALARLLRETWPSLSQPARAALAIGYHNDGPGAPWHDEATAADDLAEQSRRFLALLWRAPYPKLDEPLREAVAAVGPAAPCPYPMTDPYHALPRHPRDLSCRPETPPAKAASGGDWAVWTAPALGRSDDAWGMTHAGKRWSEPRYLGASDTARAVAAAGNATSEQRFEVMASLAFAARDSDGDGLADAVESTLGLDPTRADTDGDGVADAHDPSPLCAPVKRPLTRDEQIAADLAWHELGLSTEAMPAAFEVPGAPGSACLEVPTLGGPVLVGDEAAVKALKARLPELRVYHASAESMSPEARARVQPFQATLRTAPLAVGKWGMYRASLNAEGRVMVVALVGGRWRPVAVFRRVIS